MSVISLQPAPCFSADLLRPQQPRTETRYHSSSAAMNEAGDWARVPGTATIQVRLLLVEHIVIVLLSTILGTVLLLSLTPKPICGWVGSHEAKQELDGKSMTSKLFSVTMLCLQCPGLFSALCRTGTRSDLFRRDSKSVTTNAVSGGGRVLGLELETNLQEPTVCRHEIGSPTQRFGQGGWLE